MNAHVDGRERGAALARLSSRQVWVLLGELYRAWGMACGGESSRPGGPAVLQAVMADREHPFHAWRHEQAGRLSEGRQEDYLRILEFALRLQGRNAEADAAALRASCEPRARALHHFHEAVLRANEAAWGAGVTFDGMAYACGFLRNKRGVGLDEADARALHHAAYLLERKARLMGKAEVSAESQQREEVPF